MSERWTSHILWRADAVLPILRTVVCREGKQTVLILGQGFDPRMNDCLTLLKQTPCHRLHVVGLQIGRSSSDTDGNLRTRAERNLTNLKATLSADDIFEEVDTAYEEEDRNSTAPSASDKAIEFARVVTIGAGCNVIVDISSLPQGVYFPILEVFLGQRAEEFKQAEASLYVFVSENAELDSQITQLELQEDAYLVPPFRSALTGTDDERPIVWFPVMGEREQAQIERVQKLLPARVEREVCPILPMPASNPRRADNLIREYQDILQDVWHIDARSYIYSAEQNPFHLYRQITKTAFRYREALEQIGGCRAVISAHSSKLLSLGALMAASELNAANFDIGLANVDATHYSVHGELPDQAESTFFLVPLLGEVYDE